MTRFRVQRGKQLRRALEWATRMADADRLLELRISVTPSEAVVDIAIRDDGPIMPIPDGVLEWDEDELTDPDISNWIEED